MEKFPTSRPSAESASSVESEANYEGNDSLATIERARNPVIRAQIVDLLYQQEILKYDALKNEEWEPYLPQGWTGEERFKLLKGKRAGRIIDAEYLNETLGKSPPTKKELVRKLSAVIRHVARVTEVEFASEQPTSDRMTTAWELPTTGEKLTTKQMSIVEAHEKGHRIRPYDKELTPMFRQAFEPALVVFTEADDQWLAAERERSAAETPMPPREEIRAAYLNDYLFTPREIAERMNQLKCYFGMKGSEPFTAEHLRYAKEHYVSDTGMDNGMRFFFEATPPEKEDAFIELINSAGI